MPLGRYRINSPTIALFEQDGRHVADTVPAGALIEINRDTFDGDKLLGNGWDAPSDKEVPFEVDVKTGKHTGGARP